MEVEAMIKAYDERTFQQYRTNIAICDFLAGRTGSYIAGLFNKDHQVKPLSELFPDPRMFGKTEEEIEAEQQAMLERIKWQQWAENL